MVPSGDLDLHVGKHYWRIRHSSQPGPVLAAAGRVYIEQWQHGCCNLSKYKAISQ